LLPPSGISAADKKEVIFMSKVELKQLLEAGVHFGHMARRWNPKMRPFIYTEREGIHVIDLLQTSSRLEVAYEYVKNLVASGGEIIFVGTKRQAQDIVAQEAGRAGAMYMTQRWIGGLLTNFDSVYKNIKKLRDLREKRDKEELSHLTKKERLLIDREIAKMEEAFGGIDRMDKRPEALFVVDAKKEDNAVREAKKTGVTVVALADTNCDPTIIDYPIPANDDAIKSLKLLTSVMADAYLEGKAHFGRNQEKLAQEKENEVK
jgi:small subunit ribosomal protein S2